MQTVQERQLARLEALLAQLSPPSVANVTADEESLQVEPVVTATPSPEPEMEAVVDEPPDDDDHESLGQVSALQQELRRSSTSNKDYELLLDDSTPVGTQGEADETVANKMDESLSQSKESAEENDDEEEELEEATVVANKQDESFDDSAMYCPTVVADRRANRQPNVFTFPSPALSRLQQSDSTLNYVVETSMASPAPTNLTMDSILNTTADVAALTTVAEDAASVGSEETPILDRYRIDADEESPYGFRVVPNERRPRSTRSHNNVKHVTVMAPTTTPHRPNRTFRRTPYSKMVPSTPTIDENAPLGSFNYAETLDLVGMDVDKIDEQPRSHSLPSPILYAKASSSIDAWMNQRIEPITEQDYAEAPRVVTMQVSFADVQAAVEALNAELGRSSADTLTEHHAKRILERLAGWDERRSQKVLMGLCHWRRLVMRRHSLFKQDANVPKGRVFEITRLSRD